MGQVWQATDTQLGRQVALKILSDAFAADPDRLARFTREAQILASLNHPNIAAIYGIEESEGTRALVLELVEGPTLADRIAKGPTPLDEALPIAKQIAEALEAAHEAGVIHRDLKPANIKVREDGTVKVLDFGLAKALDPAPADDPSQSPTLTAAATQMGVIMGTAAFMSPEQASGATVDKRADIWSFGVVLYEMLTGQRLFTGETVSHVLAKVLERDIDLSVLPPPTPGPIKRLLRRCLERKLKRRLSDVGEALSHLEEASTAAPDELSAAPPVAAIAQPAGWRQALPLALVTLFVGSLISGFAVWGLMRTVPAPGVSPTRFAIALPANTLPGDVEVSADGSFVAFVGEGGGGGQLYTRVLDQLGAVPLPNTQGMAYFQGFSADDQWLLISDLREWPRWLKRMPVAGGPAVPIAPTRDLGASWGPDDTIVQGSVEGLFRVPASGGQPVQLTTLAEGERAHVRPRYLPNGRGVLFNVFARDHGEDQVAVYDFDARERRNLLPGSSPLFAASGHLMFWRAGALWAAPFDPDNLAVTGEPLPVQNGVWENGVGWSPYSVSDTGVLAYWTAGSGRGGQQNTLVWVDREGNEDPLPVDVRHYDRLELSPDGQRLVIEVGFPAGDIEIYDLVREQSTRLTFDPAVDGTPIWTSDGASVVFTSWRHFGSGGNLYRKAADGSGDVDRLAESANTQGAYSALPDGRVLITEARPDTNGDIGVLSLDGSGTIDWLIESKAQDETPAISPDGRWMAYVSDESGQFEVYVTPYPNVGDAKRQVSSDGGVQPFWGPDERELFYASNRALGGEPVTIMAVSVEAEPSFTPGVPRPLFEGRYFVGYNDIDTDGERFIMIKPVSDVSDAPSDPPQLIVVENWHQELLERVPIP